MEYIYNDFEKFVQGPNTDLSDALDAWFTVSGDTDDFIFFGESDRTHSEK